MAKTKTTVYLDEDVLRGAKVMAARTGKKDYEVVEEALRAYLGMEALTRGHGCSLRLSSLTSLKDFASPPTAGRAPQPPVRVG